MANLLESLTLEEVSLVDNPSNAETDRRTGCKIPRATVAFTKRDKERTTKRGKKMKGKEIFQQVLKAATGTNRRDQIATAVSLEARRIAKRDGITLEKAEAAVWKANPAAVEAYEAARVPDLNPQQKTLKLTGAEVELHRRARKMMRKSVGMSYAQCASKALQEDPTLYTRYQKEMAAGTTVEVPTGDFQPGSADFMYATKSDDGEDHQCPACGEEVDDDDKFCANCGKKLE